MNAVIHRDYHRHGAEVQVKIFPDHLSIFSPGGLPGDLSIDELLDTHPSVKRNNLLADIFYLAGLIETFSQSVESEVSHETPIIEGLNERQLKALELAKNGRIRTSDLQEFYPDTDSSTIRRDFRELVDKEFLKAIGSTKARFYILKS